MRRGRRALMQQGAVIRGAPSAVNSWGAAPGAAPSSVENSSKVAASSGSVRNCVPSKRPRKNCVGLTGARRGASAAALAARTMSRRGILRPGAANGWHSGRRAVQTRSLSSVTQPLGRSRRRVAAFFSNRDDGCCFVRVLCDIYPLAHATPVAQASEACVPGCEFRRSPSS